MKNSIAAILAFSAVSSLIAAQSPPLSIIPQPANMNVGSGAFILTDKTSVLSAEGDDAAIVKEAEQLASALRPATGLRLPVVHSKSGATIKNSILLSSDPARYGELGSEGYKLSVKPDSIRIHAATDAGLFYGVQTLRQLLPAESYSLKKVRGVNWTIPCVEISDLPRFSWRGIMLDVSRHFLTVDEVKKFLDLMALHKFNTLHFHLTDDQGWRMEVKKYPELTQHGSIRRESPMPGNRNKGDGKPYGPFFYTQGQIRDLVAYAQERHITIVPEIEMPGHVLGVLSAHPELSCRGVPIEVRTRWGVEADVLCVGNPKSLEFMKDVLKETMELFPSKFIHIGGDESPRDRWAKCPKCQALLKAEGLAKEAQLQTWFNHHIENFLADNGRRLIGWDEILEGGLTPGAAVMSWRGMGGGADAAQQGHDVVMSPTSHCYLDYGQGRGPNEPETIAGYLPLQTVYSFEPVPPQLAKEKRKHILSVQGNLWSEYLWTLKDFEYNGFPRACALAEVGWTPGQLKDYEGFIGRLKAHLKRLDQINVNYRKLDPPPIGEWKPAQIKTEGAVIDWDVTGAIKVAGEYLSGFNYAQGAHGIDIAWVALLEDGREIARDGHAGFAGGQPRATSYQFKLSAMKPGARYTLRAQVTGSGGSDSHGIVSFDLVTKSSPSTTK